MAKAFWLIFIFLFSFIFLLILGVNVPVSFNEAREGYNAYAHLFSTAPATYLRFLTIYVFGLTLTGVRIIGLPLGISAAYLFYLIIGKYSKNKLFTRAATAIFGFSPIIITSSLFNLDILICLVAFLAAVYFWNKSWIKFLFILLFLFSFWGIKQKTIVSDIKPSSYTYLIDKRLSFDKIYGSSLLTSKFNFNRISLNKIYYGVNAFFEALIKPFNFEKYISPAQSQTILSKESGSPSVLPLIYFWELPIIVLGLLVMGKLGKYKLLIVGSVAVCIFFETGPIFLLPAMAIFETYFWKWIIGKNRFFAVFGFLYVISLSIFVNFLVFHQDFWVNGNDQTQAKIWESITSSDLASKKIIATDRVGEPAYYYLFYNKVDPKYFMENVSYGPVVDGVRRIDSVKNVSFRSFDFNSEQKKSGEVWIGTGVDFGEKTNEIKTLRI